MKKLLAVVLAAVMALSLGVVAFAADDEVVIYLNEAFLVDGAKVAGSNEVEPDNTLYFALPTVFYVPDPDGGEGPVEVDLGIDPDFTNKDLYKVKFDKGDDNTKMISKMSLSEKKIDGERGPWLKVEIKADYTDSEYKIAPSVTITLKEDMTVDGVDVKSGFKITYQVGKYYISNTENSADQDYSAGDGGVILKPTKNEDNEITWEDENNTIATLKFVGDDDGKYFFPKLSTKWEDADYAEYFADQDAFIFNFVASSAGKTKIASTSRATLELYNPYYDADEDELTVEPEDVVIYMVGEDGALNDVTASFKPVENDDGDYVFQTKTRELGIYIIAEKPYTTAVEDVETPDDGKAIPDTGIWA